MHPAVTVAQDNGRTCGSGCSAAAAMGCTFTGASPQSQNQSIASAIWTGTARRNRFRWKA